MNKIIAPFILFLLSVSLVLGEDTYEVYSMVKEFKTFSTSAVDSNTHEFVNAPGTSEIYGEIKDPKCTLTLYAKGEKLSSFPMKENALENAYKEALNDEEVHPFFGEGKLFFLFNKKTKASFYVYVEDQRFSKEGKPLVLNGINRRFRFGPLEKLAGKWYVNSSVIVSTYKFKFPVPFYDSIPESQKAGVEVKYKAIK